MKRVSACLGILVAVIAPLCPASAADSNGGTVVAAYVQQEGGAIFVMNNITGSWPSCATTQRFVINTANMAGQALFATVLSAVKAHTPLTVHGKGVCDIWFDSESVEYLAVSS